MDQIENNKNWDYFEENFDKDKYEEKGIAELGRMYLKNNSYINRYILRYELDKEIMPIPISALGITAYSSFRHSISPEYGLNTKLGSEEFYKKYFDHCMNFLRKIENRKPLYEGVKKSDAELALAHLKEEERLFNQSQLFYNEVINESERPIIDNIKMVVLYYPLWVKETQIEKGKTINQGEPKYLFQAFESVSKYKIIMELLVSNDFLQPNTYVWKDEENSNKGTIISLLKFLHLQGYYKKKLKSKEIQDIALNTFKVEISYSSVRDHKLNPKANDFYFIPIASTIK